MGAESTTTETTTDASPGAAFTCEYCKRAPATALLVFDMLLNGYRQRVKDLVCTGCGEASGEDVRRSSLVTIAYVLRLGDGRREK